jgi:hypothetical protein
MDASLVLIELRHRRQREAAPTPASRPRLRIPGSGLRIRARGRRRSTRHVSAPKRDALPYRGSFTVAPGVTTATNGVLTPSWAFPPRLGPGLVALTGTFSTRGVQSRDDHRRRSPPRASIRPRYQGHRRQVRRFRGGNLQPAGGASVEHARGERCETFRCRPTSRQQDSG